VRAVPGPVAVTGAGGRLGRALVAALEAAAVQPLPWSRPEYDLDDHTAAARLVAGDRPSLVLHAAAWTDVDGCAREPGVAMRRNAAATGELALACAAAGAGLLVVSTNEVFDGARTDSGGYAESDATAPINAYGARKLAAERAARSAVGDGGRLWIVRTAWLFGPPGADFPMKILAAADRLAADEPLPVVSDEVGSPTFAPDLASAIVALVLGGDGAGDAQPGTYHLVNAGQASRLDWARRVLERLRPGRRAVGIDRSSFLRPSTPPAWAVLDGGKAAAAGIALRSWESALDAYLATAAAS
jgi:dTDP-4-dehydrorhamnose reductase